MTEDITSLQIRILYDSIDKAEARLKKLEGTGTKATKTVEGFGSRISSSLKGLYAFAAGATVVTGAIAGIRAIIKTTAEFQQLNAQLVTATGSAENAAAAFVAIKDFAATTPYDLQQATGAFIALVNRGLTPSERALRAYGDTASSLGASLSDMVLAVSNATAGEFENLKRFGIRAQKEGENISFTFRGVKTTVANNINDIEKYFIELGEKNFGGGMARQMETLTGAFSNLGDSWDVLKATIGEEGLGEFVEASIRNITELVAELTAQIESGQIQAAIDGWGIAFGGYVEDVSAGVQYLNEILQDHGKEGQQTGMTLSEGLMGGMKAAIIGYRSYVQSMGVILFGLVDSAVQVGKAIYQTIAASFNALIGAAGRAGAAIGNALNPFSNKSAGQGFAEAWAGVSDDITGAANTSRKAWEQSMAKIGINAEVVTGDVAKYWQEAGKEIDRAAMLEGEADQKRAEYDKDAAARAKIREDRLAKYRVGDGGGTATPTAKGKKGGGGASKESREWETLEDELRKQESLISESYQRRFDLIEKNTREGSAYQAELEISLTEKFEEEQRRRLEKMKDQPERMFEAFAEEERIIEESYAKRKEIILSATELTEAEKLKMLNEAELQYTASMRKHETERNEVALGLAADFMGNISQIAGAFGKKGAKIAKAAAIAETTVKTYQAATSAYAALAGIPYVGPALGAAAAGAAIAAGLANIQKIKSTDDSGGYSGAYAIGGAIPAGKYGLVGEAGPELVRGPAMVTSAQSTWDRMGGAQASGGSNVEVKIINMSGEPVKETRRMDGNKEMIEFIIGQAAERVANDISKGGTKVARAMEGTYNMSRGKRA
jgi:phage tail tape-measure protein